MLCQLRGAIEFDIRIFANLRDFTLHSGRSSPVNKILIPCKNVMLCRCGPPPFAPAPTCVGPPRSPGFVSAADSVSRPIWNDLVDSEELDEIAAVLEAGIELLREKLRTELKLRQGQRHVSVSGRFDK